MNQALNVCVRLVGGLGFWVLFPLVSQSQSVIPDAGSTATQVKRNNNIIEIEGGSLSLDQSNLFHSFEEFFLDQGQIADFQSPIDLQNIFVQVIGGKSSLINGELRLTGSHANFFFSNPSGIIFGPGSSLNLPASFTTTTASRIGFSDGWFDSFGNSPYEKLLGTPRFLDFTMAQPGAVANFGDLSVKWGHNLSLVGGQVLNTGNLAAPGGQVNLLSVSGNSQVQLGSSGALLNLVVKPVDRNTLNQWTLPTLTLAKLLRRDEIEQATGIKVHSDGTIQLTSTGQRIPNDAGTTISSGRIDVSDAGLGAVGGEVNVLGNRVAALSAAIDASAPGGGGTVRIGGDYQGQDPILTATYTFVDEDSVIRADALEQGNGGNIFVWANNTTQFYGFASARGARVSAGESSSLFIPKGGFVEISGRDQLKFEGGIDVSAPFGKFGTVLFDPQNITITATQGADDAVFLNSAGELLFEDRPLDNFEISSAVIASIAGNVTLQASEDITFDGGVRLEEPNNANQDLTIEAGRNIVLNPGNPVENFSGGDIRFNAGNNIMGSGTRVSTTGGNIFLNADGAIQIQNSLVQTSNKTGDDQTLGDSGNVFISAIGDIEVININTQTFTVPSNGIPANAGSVSIISQQGNVRTAPNTAIAEGEPIGGNGGDIFIQAAEDITTTTLGSSAELGSAGSIFVESLQGSIRDDSDSDSGSYSADSKSGPAGGDITLLANGSIRTPFITSASGSGFGRGGNVRIEAGEDITIRRANTANMSINTSSILGNSGDITLVSREGEIDTEIGTLNASSQSGNAGNVILNSTRGINIHSIVTSTGESQGIGGSIELDSGALLEATNILGSIYPNQSCDSASLCSAGGSQSGAISVLHRGGEGEIPFLIGETSANGTLGSITTGFDTLSSGSFLESFSVGEIRLVTQNRPLSAADSYFLPSSQLLVVSTADGVLDNDTARNGLPLIAELVDPPQNGAVNLNEDGSFTYIPRQGFTGTDSFRYVAADSFLDSSIAVVTINSNTLPKTAFLPRIQTIDEPVEKPIEQSILEISSDPIGPELFLGAVEQKQTIEIEKGLNVRCRPPKDLITIQNELRQVERDTDTQNAVIYVDFIPSDKSQNLEGVDKNDRDLWNQFGENLTSSEPSDDDQLVVALVTSDGLKVIHHIDREGKNILSGLAGIHIGSEQLSDPEHSSLAKIEAFDGEQSVLSPREYFDGEAFILNFPDSDSLSGYGILDVDDSGVPSGLNLPYEEGTVVRRINSIGSRRGALGQLGILKDALSINDPEKANKAVMEPAQILYNWLIRPIEGDLSDVDNISFVMGNGLRSLPVALLHDGEQFLVERHSVGLIPSFSCIDPTYRNIAEADTTLLAMGASDFESVGLPSLPAEKTLRDLQRLWGNEQSRVFYKSEDFTKENLQAQSRRGSSIIHLETHGAFGGSPESSYIYLGDGSQLTMEEVGEKLELDSLPTELLVLMACSTAQGDTPELSFAGASIKSGAKSVIATLDLVDYESTSAIMTGFYRRIAKSRNQKQKVTKSRILQELQIAMIRGKFTSNGIVIESELRTEEEVKVHPNQWALLTIVGSPW